MMVSQPTRRSFSLGLLGLPLLASVRSHSFHVLGLLRPQFLMIAAVAPFRLMVTIGRTRRMLEAWQTLKVEAADTPVAVSGTDGGAAPFVLQIPGVIERRYFGTLLISARDETLVPIVRTDTEVAVSSIVGSELPTSGTPFEAMAAQAIVARSFLLASGRRHTDWDFCDTTHCQFLRSPAVHGTLAWEVTNRTKGMTLKSSGGIIACRYSAACGGHTDQRQELGYLYQSVPCEVCSTYRYPRRGHGLGLCQQGAIELARTGWSHQRILAKYFPATHLL